MGKIREKRLLKENEELRDIILYWQKQNSALTNKNVELFLDLKMEREISALTNVNGTLNENIKSITIQDSKNSKESELIIIKYKITKEEKELLEEYTKKINKE